MLAIKQWFTGLTPSRLAGSRLGRGVLRVLAQPWRRRVLAGVATLIGGAVLFGLLSGPEDRAAVAAAVRDPLSVLAGRSPGPRLSGALYQTKPRKAPQQRARPALRHAMPAPSERVLAVTRTRPGAPALVGPLGAPAPDLGLLGLPGDLFTGPSLPTFGSAPAFDVPGFAFGDVPTGLTGGPNPGGGNPGTQPESPGSAVPELATWLMLVLGVGLIGQALRRQRRIDAGSPCG